MVAEPDPDVRTDAEVHIVPMRRRHLKDVIAIEEQVYPRPWTTTLFLGELAIKGTRSYNIARIGRRLVGYVGLMMTLDDGHITTIAVDPSLQRGRIGTRLLLAATEDALERGARALTLEVRVSNTGAQALYQRFGFEAVGTRKGYYTETNEDAIVMWATDISSDAYMERLRQIEATLPSPTIRGRR